MPNTSSVVTKTIKSPRIQSIDFLRGLAILFMTLDHVRDSFHTVYIGTPIPDHMSWELFFIRWITHFCAPIFVFLAGVSVFIKIQKATINKSQLQLFLLKRGIFLILLEITLISFFWNHIFHFEVYRIAAQVIWAIGLSFIFLAILLYFSSRMILLVSLVLIFGHNLLDGLTINSIIWNFLHVREVMHITEGLAIVSVYPVLPWFGIIGLGYYIGQYLWHQEVTHKQRFKRLLYLSVSGMTLFIVLRFSNLYGDPNTWAIQQQPLNTLMDFLNTNKYPPSLLYLLMTLPASWLILLAFEKFPQLSSNRLVSIVINYGRGALFYYVAHLALIPIVNRCCGLLLDGTWQRYHSEYLWVTWLVTIGLICILYPAVKFFFKLRFSYAEKFPILKYF